MAFRGRETVRETVSWRSGWPESVEDEAFGKITRTSITKRQYIALTFFSTSILRDLKMADTANVQYTS